MKNQLDQITACFQLQQARELMAQGQHEKALVLALSALQHALNHLRDALLALQNNLAQTQLRLQHQPPQPKETPEIVEFVDWEKKPRVYH